MPYKNTKMKMQQHNLFNRIREAVSVARYAMFKEYVTEQAGISVRYLYKIMQGEHKNPTIKVLQALSDWFGCTLDELLNPNHVLVDAGIKCKSAQDPSPEDDLARLFSLKKEAA